MPVLDIQGLKFNSQVLGDGPCLVMLHGLLIGNLATWYLAAGGLASSSRRVLLYDMRGHGSSGIPASGYDLASMTGDLAGIAEATVPGEILELAGFSYGSLVALKFALTHPDRVRRLVLVEAPLPPLAGLVERYLNADVSSLLASIPVSARAALLASPRRVMAVTKRVRHLIEHTTLVADVRAEPAFAVTDLARLDLPTLCVYGTDSEFLSDGKYLAETLPNARLHVLQGSHQLLHESGAQVAALIKEFLNG